MSDPGAASVPAPGATPPAIEADRPVVLSARGLEKAYRIGGHPLPVLRGVDLDVKEGEVLAVLGASGSGKSTLLHVLGWIDSADAGAILYEGQDRASLSAAERAVLRNRLIGFVFQLYHLLPELDALENVLLPAMILHGPVAWRHEKKAALERARSLLDRVGLSARAKHRPAQLSGG